MGAVVEIIEDIIDIVEDVVEGVVEAVETVWDDIVMPLLEFVVGIFGIEDETVVQVQHVSQKVYPSTTDLEEDALVKIALEYTKNSAIALISPFNKYTKVAQGKIDGYYNYAEEGEYPYALPTTNVRKNTIDQSAVINALFSITGYTVNITSAVQKYPTKEVYFKHYLQNVYSYLPHLNTLTFSDEYGTFDSYFLSAVTYNAGANNYQLTVQRLRETATFYLSGYSEVVQGDNTLMYTVSVDRLIPANKTVTVNLSYTGTATNGTHFTSVDTVVLLAGTSYTDFTISTEANSLPYEYTLLEDQTEANYDDSGSNGSYSSSGSDSTNFYSALDTITLDNDDVLTVDSVDVDGNVITFTVTSSGGDASAGTTINQISSSGTGLGFTITPETVNLLSSSVTMVVSIESISTQDSFEATALAEGKHSISTTITYSVANPVDTDNTNMPSPLTETLTSVITRPAYRIISYVIVTYYIDEIAEWKYWVYDISSNTYPDVKMVSSSLSNLEFMPIGILRSNTVSASVVSVGQENYDGIVGLLGTLDLEFNDIIQQIEANPNIAGISEGFLSFAVNPTDTATVVSKILYEMFYTLVITEAVDFNTTVDNQGYYATFLEQNVKRAVVWSTQNASTTIFDSGPIGTYSHTVTNVNTLTMRKQVSTTSCSTIVLTNMSGIEFILGNGQENMSLSKLGDDNFSILLSHFSIDSLTPVEQLQLYTLALRMNFYSVQITEVAWYETSAFADLLEIVLIVYTLITFDPTKLSLAAFFQVALANYVIISIAIAIISSIDSEFLKVVVAAGAAYLTSQTGSGSTGMSDPAVITQSVTQFSNMIVADINADILELQAEMLEINNQFDIRSQELARLIEAQENGLDPTYLAFLNSPDTYRFMAGPIQYNYSSMYDYGTVVGNYHKNALTLGVV